MLRDPAYPTCPYETPPWIVLLRCVIFLSTPSSKAVGTTHDTALKLLWIWSLHTIAENVINNNPSISMEFSSKEFKESSIYFFSLHLVSAMEEEHKYSPLTWPWAVTLPLGGQFPKVWKTRVGRRGRSFRFDIWWDSNTMWNNYRRDCRLLQNKTLVLNTIVCKQILRKYVLGHIRTFQCHSEVWNTLMLPNWSLI